MSREEYTEVVVDEVIQATDNAFLLDFEDVGQEWVPRSLIETPDDLTVGNKNTLVNIATWKAKQLNLH